MRSDFKYLALGLMIGMIAAALAALAIYFSVPAARAFSLFASPTPLKDPASVDFVLPSVTPTFTAVPTRIPPSATPTALPPPTATPDAMQSMVDSGGLAFAGPLSNAEQIALYKASLAYVQTSVEGSRRISQQINGVGYGDPTNICGPLAIAILRDAGLLPQTIVPHDFWLLNPLASIDAQRLNQTFPFESYMYIKELTPINKMDWRASPLLPGDFLFIWHGSGGNFDHMLVVTRVDNQHRVYAVTNYGTQDGYIIGEAMLYDPNDPTLGLFHTWTQEQNAILGSTGFGGFELWRRRSP